MREGRGIELRDWGLGWGKERIGVKDLSWGEKDCVRKVLEGGERD